jgi:hypothetical protein
MVTALASLYTQMPARGDTAMTGEITLSGLVFPKRLSWIYLSARRQGFSTWEKTPAAGEFPRQFFAWLGRNR